MLASIHPLGERARHQRFAVTATAYVLASTVAAAAFGALLGLVGRALLGDVALAARGAAVVVVAALAAVLDARRVTVPSWHRQVNEDWLADYRGWVYGAGFGAQLGIGVITIVTTASVYATWLGALLVASPAAGALVGAAFGLVRALPVAAAGRSDSPDAVAGRVRRLDRWDGRFRAVTIGTEAVAALAVLLVVVL